MICFFNTSRIVSLLLDHTNYFNRLFHCQNSCAGPQRFFLFYVMRMQKCHLNTGLKLFLKISRLRSSTVELYVWLLSRLVHHHLLCVYLYIFLLSWTLSDGITEFSVLSRKFSYALLQFQRLYLQYIKSLFVQSYKAILSLFRYTGFPFLIHKQTFKCHITHSTTHIDD